MKDEKEQRVQTAIRFPKALLERADKLASQMRVPGMNVMRADVLRMAAFAGIELLETQQRKEKKTR